MLLTRLEETALGAGMAMAVVLLVLPLRTRRVVHVALRQFVQAIGRLAEHASDHLRDPDSPKTALRSDARAVDAAYQTLVTAAQPLRPLGGDIPGALRLAAAARNYSRNLVADTTRTGLPGAALRLDLELANEVLQHSLDAIAGSLTGSPKAAYTRSAALFDHAERRLAAQARTVGPAQLAIRDLKLIDGTMATLAKTLRLPITDYDTVPAVGTGGTTVRGRVRAPDGTGVGPAALALIDPLGRQAARTTAGLDGAFWLDAPSAGVYTLLASASAHAPAASTVTVREPAASNETVVNIHLAETSRPRVADD